MSLLERDDQLLGLEAALEAARQVGSRHDALVVAASLGLLPPLDVKPR